MVDAGTALFTVAVFQDAQWAAKGLSALRDAGFTPNMFSIVAKESPDAAALIEKTFGATGEKVEIANLGTAIAHGPVVGALQGSGRDLGKVGIAGSMRRVGCQPHDGRIFETLTGRGGVLVAIQTEPRAADALAILFSYGGGNAAIGAWTGRV